MASKQKTKPQEKPAVALEPQIEVASRLLTGMANAKRLLVLCNLLDGEKSVGELSVLVSLSQAALSQHLSKMHAHALVDRRRDGQTIYYRLASKEARGILKVLYRLYCAPDC
jgi:ArsR family transcriptional regulator, virulence genes transcriptional regulator